MNKIIDISVPLKSDTPVWPGSRKFSLKRAKNLEAGDDANVSILECDVHTGTHIDAPGHFIRGAETVEQISLNKLIGPAYVVYIPDVNTINAGDLDKLKLPAEVKRLLLRTRNSELWNRGAIEFNKKFVALTSGAAQWIVDRGIDLIGIDYLSIQRFTDPPITHRILLEAKVVIVEGLNLWAVDPGKYEFICLPLNLLGAEGAPARAVLRLIE